MGSMQAEEMLEHAGFDTALRWHLQSNHYPPIHPSFIPVAKSAIEHGNNEEWDTVLKMPNGISKTVSEIIEGLHLQTFLD